VGLKPSANQGEARLRGLYRIIYSKTMSPHVLRSSEEVQPLWELLYFFKDHTPSAIQGEASQRQAIADRTSSVPIRRIRADPCSIPPWGW